MKALVFIKNRGDKGVEVESMADPITASMLYNLVQCPHRVTMDAFGDLSNRDPISKFVQLLWERGTAFEKEVIEGLDVPFTDLSELPPEERTRETEKALKRGDALIYRGRISAGDLLGEPDLLRREEDGYVAGDIKSGAGEEGSSDLSDRKPKKHYAVQLALYTHILENLGLSSGHRAFVWDIHSEEIEYDFSRPQGPRTPETLWALYERTLEEARSIVAKTHRSRPCLAGICKLCHWRSACGRELRGQDDLSLIPELGRAKRDGLLPHVNTVKDFATMDASALIDGKKTVVPRLGAQTLLKLQARAQLLAEPKTGPYLTESLVFPESSTELFFDIEADPMRDICYLHGFVERENRDSATERFIAFLAESPSSEEEERIFCEALAYIRSKEPCAIYYYSKYERTWWRNLQSRYPTVATKEEIEDLFSPEIAVDLYFDAVQRATVWPTNDHSIKTLAKFLGFKWRDASPSGADSIEWYHRWVETGDASIRDRILEYNQDDCLATRVLLDGLRRLPVKPGRTERG